MKIQFIILYRIPIITFQFKITYLDNALYAIHLCQPVFPIWNLICGYASFFVMLQITGQVLYLNEQKCLIQFSQMWIPIIFFMSRFEKKYKTQGWNAAKKRDCPRRVLSLKLLKIHYCMSNKSQLDKTPWTFIFLILWYEQKKKYLLIDL